MRKSELAVIVILRIIGFSALLAIPFIFVPYSLMNQIHEFFGLGQMPDTPIVSYLARSLSAFYAVVGVFILYVSWDIDRYQHLVTVWGIVFCALGFVLLGIDLAAGMPLSWTLFEGPPAIAVGAVVLWLHLSCRKRS